MSSFHPYIKNIILCILLLLGVYIVFVFFFSYNFSSDVYRKSERYQIKLSDKEVINNVNQFKELNREYRLITTDEEGNSIYYQDIYSSKYYHIFFYFEDIDITIQCLLKSKDTSKTEILLYSLSNGVNFARWKDINSENLTNEENRKIKKKFEVEILDRLGEWRHLYFWE